MGGASERHNLIVTNVVREVSQQLKGRPCKTYPTDCRTDMRGRIAPSGLYTYPDVVVVCGEARFDDDQRDTLLNPTLLVEVLSASTEAYDRGDKFEHYRKLDSLAEYLLIAQDRMHVELFVRRAAEWVLTECDGRTASRRLPSIDATLALARIGGMSWRIDIMARIGRAGPGTTDAGPPPSRRACVRANGPRCSGPGGGQGAAAGPRRGRRAQAGA